MNKVYLEASERCAKVQVWNREYVFDGSVWPTSVKIGGEEILYAPISMTAEFDGVVGEWENQRVIPTKSGEDFERFSVAMSTENIIVNGDIIVEADGFAKINFSVMNFWSYSDQNKPRLTKLYVDIPVKAKFAPLMHYWPNCESGVCLSSNVLNSHAVPEGKTVLGFKPYVWTGWEYGGMGICCEDPRSMEVEDLSQCMSVENCGEYVNLHIALLDDMPENWKGRVDNWGDDLMPVNYTFGLQATPVKKFDDEHTKHWRVFHTNIDLYEKMSAGLEAKTVNPKYAVLEKLADMGVKWIVIHERWSTIQNYGLPWDEAECRRFIKDCHDLGMKVMTYFGYELSSLYPGFNEKSNEWINKNTKGNFVGGWQRRPIQRDFTVCYKSGYKDVLLERVKYVMDEYGVDGIYTDGTFVPWECANEAHGCGYRDKKGELHFSYPIFAVREFVKELCGEIHKRGGLMDTHQSSCMLMATLGFADSYYDGENIQGMLIRDIENMRLDTFRTEYVGTNVGIPCNFITYTEGDFTARRMAGVTFLHNSYPRVGNLKDMEFVSRLWKAVDDYNLSAGNWHPYWEQNEVRTGDAKNYASYYTTGTGIVVATVNHNAAKDYIELFFDKEYVQVKDILTGEVYPVENRSAKIPARALDLQLYEVC